MGLRDKLLGLLSKGESPEADPDAAVEIAVVPLSQAPMLIVGLRQEGFDARFFQAFDVVGGAMNHARIFVRQADATAAIEALDRLR